MIDSFFKWFVIIENIVVVEYTKELHFKILSLFFLCKCTVQHTEQNKSFIQKNDKTLHAFKHFLL